LNDFVKDHREFFSIVIIDFAVWKFVFQRSAMVALVDLLKPNGKLYLIDPEEPEGGMISLKDVPYEQAKEYSRAQKELQ